MGTNLWITILLILVAVFLAVKFAKKLIRFVLIVLVIASATVYIYFGTDFFNNSKSKQFTQELSVENLLTVYCGENVRVSEKLKCDCIVRPIYDDLKSRLSPEEITKIEANKVLFVKELLTSYQNKKDEIKGMLKKNGAPDLFAQFKADLTNGNFIHKFRTKNE